ncbi:hypothetical protein PSTT_07702 [Puccinia striiformis]|uniref:RING-type domain-containing protein n=1 Tax=Puccinia striiformis TaxID=27350 RepID=A0A2S4VF98_9BASI|nr:hypothetical protein PSTT_07702 [Puccinia striiformis]
MEAIYHCPPAHNLNRAKLAIRICAALSRSGILANTPPTVHRDSDGPGGAIELQAAVERSKGKNQIPTSSGEGSTIRVLDNGSASEMDMECAVCLEEFNSAALGNEKLIPGQAPLRQLVACSHTYHRHCIDKWLADPSKTCPPVEQHPRMMA